MAAAQGSASVFRGPIELGVRFEAPFCLVCVSCILRIYEGRRKIHHPVHQ